MSSEKKNEVFKLYNERLDKYIYYLIALSVSSIAYSVYCVKGEPLKITHIPLGISVLCWAISIYFGLSLITLTLRILNANSVYLGIIAKLNPNEIDYETRKQDNEDALKTTMLIPLNKVNLFLNILKIGFYTGVASFIVWQFIQMWSIT